MKVSKKAAALMLLIVSLATIFFACTKKKELTALSTSGTISAVTSSASSNSATITWTTGAVATSKVYYGLTDSFGSFTTESDTGASMTRNHSVNITGLTAGTKYYYYVTSKDAVNNTSTLGNDGSYTFTTTSAGPTISNVAATSSASTSATVTWTTNEGATSQVFYGLTSSFGSNTTETTATTATSHSVSLTGLTASTTYYYYVRSKNAAGNASTSGADGTKTVVTKSGGGGSTTFNLYLDDIKLEGTGGTTVIFYDDAVTTDSTVFTGGSNNFAYMGSAADGSAPDINSLEFAATEEKNSGSCSWRTNLNASTTGWNGIMVLASGQWRSLWNGTQTAGSLSGPTGVVTLSCYAKVTGITSTKIKIGLGDDSVKTVSGGESIGSPYKKESNATTIYSTVWTPITVSLGTNPNLSAINGLFLWSMSMTDVTP